MQSDPSGRAARFNVNEHEAAEATGFSVHFLRKDRVGDRLIPFFKIGRSVRYDLTRVWEALASYEQGGPKPRKGPR